MLKNLILDIGNVICVWDPDALLASTFEHPDEQRAALQKTVNHADWLLLDRGTMSKADAVARAQSRCPELDPARISKLYDNLPASLAPIETTVSAMREAAEQDVPMYVLSNMNDYAWKYLDSTFDFWSTCRGIVVSCNTGLIKPEADIYHHLTDRFSLQPDECVFVDDMAVNTEAAKACGWQAIQLTDRSQGGEVIHELITGLGAVNRR